MVPGLASALLIQKEVQPGLSENKSANGRDLMHDNYTPHVPLAPSPLAKHSNPKKFPQ